MGAEGGDGRGRRRAGGCRSRRQVGISKKMRWTRRAGAVEGTRRARRGSYRAAGGGARATRGARGRVSGSNARGVGASGRWVSARTEILEVALLLGVFDVLERGFGAPRGRAAPPGRHGFGRTRFGAEHRGRTRAAGARRGGCRAEASSLCRRAVVDRRSNPAGPLVLRWSTFGISGRRKRPDARFAPTTRGAERAPPRSREFCVGHNGASGAPRAHPGRRGRPGERIPPPL